MYIKLYIRCKNVDKLLIYGDCSKHSGNAAGLYAERYKFLFDEETWINVVDCVEVNPTAFISKIGHEMRKLAMNQQDTF